VKQGALLLLAVWLGLSFAGCRTLGPASHASLPRCESPLVHTAAMGGGFHARYAVRVRYGDVDQRFTLVAELAGGRLVLVALGPFGAEIFALVQEGREVALAGPVLPGFPVPPRNVLGDLHGLRFLGAASLLRDGVAKLRSCGSVTSFALVEERRPDPGGEPASTPPDR